ncbi:nucleotidyltransferase family protein [Planctomycetota bacterium]
MVWIIEDKRKELELLCRQYHVGGLEVFGSAARDDFDPASSDIDFLVRFDESVGSARFDNFFAFQAALGALFGKPVDLVEPGGLKNPYFIKRVNQTRRVVYGAP